MAFPVGKLPLGVLQRLLAAHIAGGDRVVVGPRVGEDCAVIDMGGSYLLAKTDPITFVAPEIGRYAVQINANDIATMGGIPRWFLATVLLPEGKTDEALAEEIFAEIAAACRETGIALCGGHTEITAGLSRPIVVGQMLGEVERDRLVTSDGARPGDDLILTKGVPIEAVSILARERGAAIEARFGAEFLSRCRDYVRRPGLSVVPDARIAVETGGVHAMHDPTEGGAASGLVELGLASNVGLVVWKEEIPVTPEGKQVCDLFGIDPLASIASGALLVACNSASTDRILSALGSRGIPAARIGRVLPKGDGLWIEEAGKRAPLAPPDRDEIARLFAP
jgi:hydrogenase maturation factor